MLKKLSKTSEHKPWIYVKYIQFISENTAYIMAIMGVIKRVVSNLPLIL